MRFILLLLLLVGLTAHTKEPIPEQSVFVSEVSVVLDTTNEGRVIKILADSGYSVGMQQIILAQAKLESGNFTNSLTRKWNNAFAMLHSKCDPYSVGNYGRAEGRSGYAVYKSLEESVYARLWYSRKWKYPVDVNLYEYVMHIKRKGYFTGDADHYYNNMRDLIARDASLFENKSVTITCR
jgi:hypothetical protein